MYDKLSSEPVLLLEQWTCVMEMFFVKYMQYFWEISAKNLTIQQYFSNVRSYIKSDFKLYNAYTDLIRNAISKVQKHMVTIAFEFF